MDNQHTKITGYRELTNEEVELMNEIKALANQCGDLVNKLRVMTATPEESAPQICDQRWVAIGTTDLQTGFMALVRSVAKPNSF